MRQETKAGVIGPLRVMASLYFGAVVLVLLLVALACATVDESMRGTEHALETFYRSRWFFWLLALLGFNVLAAIAIHMPIPRAKVGFVITHLSLVLILIGALVTKFAGLDGQLALFEGEHTDNFHVPIERITLTESGTKREATQVLDTRPFGGLTAAEDLADTGVCIGNVKVDVRAYLPDAIPVTGVAASEDAGRPAVQVVFSRGDRFESVWVFAGVEQTIDGLAVRYTPVPSDEALRPLLESPAPSSDAISVGSVQVDFDGRSTAIPVEACLGRTQAIGDTVYGLRVVEYLPHAIVGRDNKLANASSEPKNPAIRVEITGPEGLEERIAFAHFPDFDSMHAPRRVKELKIKFLFAGGEAGPHARAPVEIFSTPGGPLYVRFETGDGVAQSHSLSPGTPVASPWDGRMFRVLQRLDSAQARRSFELVDPPRENRVPAIRVAISDGTDTNELWLAKNRPQTFTIGQRGYEVFYGDRTVPLGFGVRLDKFTVGYYPGGRRPRSFESQVTITDGAGLSQTRVIRMNHPTTFGGFTLYQSSYELTGSRAMSVLSVARDPGLSIVFAGYVGLLAGMTWVLVNRMGERRRAMVGASSVFSRRRGALGRTISLMPSIAERCVDDPGGARRRSLAGERAGTGTEGDEVSRQRGAMSTARGLALAALLCVGGTVRAQTAPVGDSLDFSVIRKVAVQHDGRWCPLDTLARDVVEEVTGDVMFNDVDPVAHLLAWTFDPSTWRRRPLISIRNGELRGELKLPSQRRVFSFQELVDHTPLRTEINGLSRVARSSKLNPLQSKVSDINGRLIQLQQVFRGEVIRLIPDATDLLGAWQPIVGAASGSEAEVGLLAVRNAWTALGQAFLDNDAAGFSKTSSLLTAAAEALPAATRPAAARLQTELRYNRLHPFGVAWKVMVVGAVLAAAAMFVRRRWCDWLSLLGVVAGFAILTYGLWLRWQIAGRIPASNMFESLLFLSWGTGVFAILSFFLFKDRLVPLTASGMGATSLVLADVLPIDSFIRPIAPVLLDTIWMSIHVPAIMVSYSVLALAVVVAHAQLIVLAVAPHRTKLSGTLDGLHYWYVHVGSILLTAGIITGSMWAASSWGRYWGWDPKEVWSLVALLGYLTILHVRIDRDRLPQWAYLLGGALCVALFAVVTPKLAPLTSGKALALLGTAGGMAILVLARGPFATCAKSVLCFWLILMTYLGVNYVLGTGLHSYGFGTGAVVKWMFRCGAIDLGLVALCSLVYMLRRASAGRPSGATVGWDDCGGR